MKHFFKLSGTSILGAIAFALLPGFTSHPNDLNNTSKVNIHSYEDTTKWAVPFSSSKLPEIKPSDCSSFGSGDLGTWETDEFGAPVYRYTCNQLTDPIAFTRVNPEWISPTNHMHQIGNDRLVGVVSNYGYVQVRQDEGSPKFLNDFDPKRGAYGGGIGILTDGENSFSTFFPGNASFTSYVLDLYGTLLNYIGEEDLASASKKVAEEQQMAVREQWAGKWFKRQWLNDSLGWIGEDVMWLEPQPWAIIGGASTREQTKELVSSLNEYMRDPSPIGAYLHSEKIESMPVPAGTLTNAGVWPSINGTLIWALANVDKNLGWEEWKKNTLAYHAEAYPDVWYGIWSGPDSYNSVLSDHPGHTYVSADNEDEEVLKGVNWTDFPVMNMHPHAWPLYDVPKLFGLEFTTEGFQVNPTFPSDYHFSSPLVSLKKDGSALSGTYHPATPGTWKIVIRGIDGSEYKSLIVNYELSDLTLNEKGEIVIHGSSTLEAPLKWELLK